MSFEMSILAQVLAFVIGYIVSKMVHLSRQYRFLNSLSADTLLKINNDIERNQRLL